MKKIFSILIITLIISSIFFSCGKEQPQIIKTNIYDTVFIRDSIFRIDTIFIVDSIFTTDTIVVIDTVLINDTSEFDYLFNHYELDSYELLFYTIDKQKSPYTICRMKSDELGVEILADGMKIYPVWAEDDNSIYYVDFGKTAVIKKDISNASGSEAVMFNIDRNIQFLWYHPVLETFLFSYSLGEDIRIAAYDMNTAQIIELSETGVREANPVSSKTDDWIYYSAFKNDTWDIYRKKIDGSQNELVYGDRSYNFVTFNVSSDGRFLITPKFVNGKGSVVFYDINRQTIIHDLILPVEGHPLYSSLSDDNKAIFFVNGSPYDYTKPRNIYRMALDKTQLMQLTHYEDYLAIRPLIR